MKKPNILVFVTDQHRAEWLSCMGNSTLRTPNIDSIAENGVLFEKSYCNTPLCMPSRATMWTGLHASGHGLRTNGTDLDPSLPTLPQILHDNGYKTISVGKIHISSWHMSYKRGNTNIDEYNPELLPECETVWFNKLCEKLPENYYGLDVTHFLGGHGGYCFGEYLNWLEKNHHDACDKLVNRESMQPSLRSWDNYYSIVPNEVYYNEWIKNLTMEEMDKCSEEQPFFIWCSFPDPHFPFGPPAPYNKMYNPEDMPEPVEWNDKREGMNEFYHKEYYEKNDIYSTDGGPTDLGIAQIKETMALAYGMVNSVDDCIGQIMNHLKSKGLYEDTIVVFLSDHGELMGDHGLFCKGPFHYEGLLHVPMIFSWPGYVKKGLKTKALASTIDFMPTILELVGAEYPDQFAYQSNKIHTWAGPYEGKDIYENVSYLPGKSLTGILNGKCDKVQESILVEDDDDIRKVNLRSLITDRYKMTIYSGKEYGELFDLQEDPTELNNLWDDNHYAGIKAELMAELAQQMMNSQPRLRRRIGIA